MSIAVNGELKTRFLAAFAQLNPEGKAIGLAVSGGPDSLAMLLLAHGAIPGKFAVASVNHGTRAAAADECALVAEVCAERAIPCAILQVELAKGNVQEQARIARYAALRDWAEEHDLAMVATAHHADDQAETLLMRLNRGSGVAGLAGVRASGVVEGLQIIRPMLGFRHTELEAVCAKAGIDPARDPSNKDEKYDRVRMRQSLADCDWLDPMAIAQSARNLADAYDALQEYADLLWPEHARVEEGGIILRPATRREMNRRLLARAMEELGGKPSGGEVTRLLMRLERGENGNLAGLLAKIEQGNWVLRPEPPRRSS